ncbi:chromosome segregation protein [Rhodotorula toruloides]|uniref:Chromosome segregation protein n=1 Tax=Rhodotorula toruloides TaxID=5286 RepID=A0A511KQ31_RHOTO|nr:chromosome segregation protein [Rhodotorula toruloides]
MGEDANKLVVTAHAEGVAQLTFAPDGRYLYTSGYEGFIRIFDARLDADANAEPAIVDYHEEAVISISATTEYLCSASESGQVVLHKAGKTDLDGFLTRFSLPARSVRFDPRGKRAVVTSDEVIAKVVDVKEPTKVQILTGHARSIREASWSPDGQLVTTSSTDGQIRVWQLDGGTEPTCIQVLDGLIKAEDADSEYSCEVVWHPAGKFFVVPSKDSGEIAMVSRETWQKTGTFSSRDGHTGRISAVAFSSNGLYLASASDDLKEILIWSVKDRSIVSRTPHTHGMITCLAFHPASTANSLAYIDNKGQLTRWEGAVPSGLLLPTFSKPPASTTSATTGASKSALATGGGGQRSDSVPTSTSSHAGGARGGNGLFRKEASEDEFDDLDDGALDGWIDDDLNDGALNGLDSRGMSVDPFADDVPIPPKRGESAIGGRSRSLVPLLGGESSRTKIVEKGQPPFQPGATKWREDRRYLAFNMIGYIYAVDRHDDGQAVTIEFHDRSAHIASKFDDKMKYNLAALGELGAIFSCPSAGDSPSQLFYKPYESWTALQTWTASLPTGEQATALAIGGIGPAIDGSAVFDDPTVGLTGSGTILVATSRGFVRFFSGAGLQKYIWNVGEEVVAMAAGKDWAAVVYRAGVGAGLDYSLIDTDTFEVVQQGMVPLSKGASLAWLGFTSDNIPVMYDSKGLISILDRSRRPRQGRWLPALDTNALPRKDGKQESYWLVGVTDQQAHVIILKGGEKEPHFPTPLLQEFDLQVPLLNLDVPQGQLAEKYLRESLFVQHRKDGAPADDYSLKTELARQEVQTDKHLLQIIQTFCKADKLEAALDAVLLLSQPASLIAAAKIAAFFDLPSLKERIELLQQTREDAGDPDEANAKRQSKWAHLADDRFITSAPVGGTRTFGTPGAAAARLFGPGGGHANNNLSFSPRPAGSSAFGSARRAFGTPALGGPSSSSKKRKSSQGQSALAGSDGAMQDDDDDFALEYADEIVEEDEPASSPKRMRVDSEEIQIEGTQEVAPAPKKAANPFAKRASNARPSASHAANPFADKKAGKAKDLGRTDSFFHRVEGKEAPKPRGKGRASASSTSAAASTKAKATTTGGMQMTLFGLPPGKEPEKKTKKRWSTADEGEENASGTADSTASSSTRKLEGFRKKPGTAATGGLGAEVARELPREDEEMEETQMVEETQQEEESLPAPPVKRRDSELEAVTEEQEVEGEDTQMSQTQVETQVEDPESLKENTRPPSSAASEATSKLAQFAYKKPDVVPDVATPPAEAVEAAQDSALAA